MPSFSDIHLDDAEIQRLRRPPISRQQIAGILTFRPRNLDFYRQAMIHKSVLRLIKYLEGDNLPKYMLESNERLEFLGDAILSCITADYLYKKFPDRDEGFLTRVRSKLVDTKALSSFARRLEFEKHILMSRHLKGLDERNKEKLLENTFEAWIGAIYLDTNLEYARKFVLHVFDTMVNWKDVLQDTNYKDQVTKHCQLNRLGIAEYVVVHTEGPPHDRIFTVHLLVNKKVCGIGITKQKKSAEQVAAKNALVKLTGKSLTELTSMY